MPTDLSIAEEILSQLGGRRFIAMTGAKNFVGGDDNLTFRLPANPGFVKNRINMVRFTLTPADVYVVAFYRIRGVRSTEISRHRDVYVSDLRRLFTQETGLDVSL